MNLSNSVKFSQAVAPTAPRAPPPVTPAPRRHWWRYDLPVVHFRADAFVRVDHMLEQTVEHTSSPGDVVPDKHFRFGGDVFQIGAMATVGW